ncbi:hypothetical protein GCM10027256_29040 [Novispirillum itersonii subsp. nipponicum]|uniref:Uncharacterized protein n=1 Tax=Novispirillum itersonii TaxID=189 RepID=A0A7X0DMY7_NOVIT|nr:hypothetical protein [Novispirillum itersonii]
MTFKTIGPTALHAQGNYGVFPVLLIDDSVSPPNCKVVEYALIDLTTGIVLYIGSWEDCVWQAEERDEFDQQAVSPPGHRP